MTSCWQFDQKERPSFGEIHSTLSSFKMDSDLCDHDTPPATSTISDTVSHTETETEDEKSASVQE